MQRYTIVKYKYHSKWGTHNVSITVMKQFGRYFVDGNARIKRDVAQSNLSKLLPFRRRCMPPKLSLTQLPWPNDYYLLFTVQFYSMLHHGVLKNLKEFSVNCHFLIMKLSLK